MTISRPGHSSVKTTHHTTRCLLQLVIQLIERLTLSEDEIRTIFSQGAQPFPSPGSLRKYIKTLNYVGFKTTRRVKEGTVYYRLERGAFSTQVLKYQHAQSLEELMVHIPNESSLHVKLGQLVPPSNFNATPYTLESIELLIQGLQNSDQGSLLTCLLNAIKQRQFCGLLLHQSTAFTERTTQLWGIPYLCTPVGLRDAVISFTHVSQKYLFHIKLTHIYQITVLDESNSLGVEWFAPLANVCLHLHPELARKYELKPAEAWDVETNILHIMQGFHFQLLCRLLKYDTLCTVVSPPQLQESHTRFNSLQQRIFQHCLEIETSP